MFENTRSTYENQSAQLLCGLTKDDPSQKSEGPRGPSLHNPQPAESGSDKTTEVSRIRVVAGEDRVQIAGAHVTRGDF